MYSSSFCSYGLIAFRRGTHDHSRPPEKKELSELQYRLVQRRDTSAYITFLQGKVPSEKYPRYFSMMTPDEHQRLLSHSYQKLWEDLFFKRNYNREFEAIFSSLDLKKLIEENPAQGTLKWEFPKGKKITRSENDFVCAMREYREETLDQGDIKVVDTMPLQITTHEGKYSKITTLFLAKICFSVPINQSMISVLNRRSRTNEVQDAIWASYEKCLSLLPSELCVVIKHAHSLLKGKFNLLDPAVYINKNVFLRQNAIQIPLLSTSEVQSSLSQSVASSLQGDSNLPLSPKPESTPVKH